MSSIGPRAPTIFPISGMKAQLQNLIDHSKMFNILEHFRVHYSRSYENILEHYKSF